MRIMMRRYSQRLILADSDEVMVAFPIPAGGTLNNIWLQVHAIGPEETGILTANIYGMAGFVVPMTDPDTQVNAQQLWDRMVPKDVAGGQGSFDIDTTAEDSTPEFEPGLVDWSGVFDLTSLDPVEIFRRRKLVTLASSPVAFQQREAALDLFVPVDHFRSQIKRSVRVNTPSMALIAFSSPQTTSTSTSEQNTPTEGQWSILQNLERVLEDMVYFQTGLVEAGAETPYDIASIFLEDLLEDVYFEETAGRINPISWVVHCWATADITVPGRRKARTLSSE